MSDELLNLIDEILNSINYDSNTNKSIVPSKFGKKSVILVGDLSQLSTVSTFYKPITQLYSSFFFKDNFVPFILSTNIRAINDKLYCAFLSKCRIGDNDFPYIQSRICGEGLNSLMNVKICSIL